jgi:uncharacterized membrane protein YhhN
VFAGLYIKFGFPVITKKSYAFKMVAAVSFVMNGLFGYLFFNKSVYSKWVLLGLFFGFLGDVIIALEPFIKENEKKKKHNTIAVTAGGALFFLGHVFYIVAFAMELKRTGAFKPALYFGIVGGTLALGMLTMLLTKIKMKKFSAPIAVYAVAITSMFALAVNVAITNTTGGIFFNIALIAAPLLFVISDGTIVLKFFNKQKFATMPLRIVNLGTYFIAQVLFGLTIYLINS